MLPTLSSSEISCSAAVSAAWPQCMYHGPWRSLSRVLSRAIPCAASGSPDRRRERMERISGIASRICSRHGGRSGIRDAGRGFCARSTSRSSVRATLRRASRRSTAPPARREPQRVTLPSRARALRRATARAYARSGDPPGSACGAGRARPRSLSSPVRLPPPHHRLGHVESSYRNAPPEYRFREHGIGHGRANASSGSARWIQSVDPWKVNRISSRRSDRAHGSDGSWPEASAAARHPAPRAGCPRSPAGARRQTRS